MKNRLFDFYSQETARRASKAATDAIWAQKNGTCAYSLGGKIIACCGIGWGLLCLIPILCGTPIIEWFWMLVLSAIQIVLGIVLVILSKKSKRFQEWANKDFEKGLKKKKKLEEKVQVGKKTLPITHGDVLAFKILGIMAAVFVIMLGVVLLFQY